MSLDEFKVPGGQQHLLNQYFSKRKQIEINNAVYIMKKRFTKYESPESDRQFQALYKSADLHNRNRLTEMLHYFVGPMWAKIILVMIQFEKTDHDIFTFIKMNFKPSESFQYQSSIACSRSATCFKDTRRAAVLTSTSWTSA